jgi:hypothetical protein
VNEGWGTGKETERDSERQRETGITWVRDDASAAKVLPMGKDFKVLQNAADCVCKSILLHLQSAMHFAVSARTGVPESHYNTCLSSLAILRT